MKALLVDVDHVLRGGKPLVRVILKGKKMFKLYDKFLSYFYFLPKEEKEKIDDNRIIEIKKVKRKINGEEKEIFQIYCSHADIPLFAEKLKGEVYEDKIPLEKKYILEKGIKPMNLVEIEREGKFIKSIKDCGEADVKLKPLFFDIEVYNPAGISREKFDPIIAISYADENESKVITWRKTNLKEAIVVKNEAELIETFCRIVKEKDAEILIGYNSSAYDLPYLKARAKINEMELSLGRDGSEPKIRKMGTITYIDVVGRVNFDVFSAVRFLAVVQALKTRRYTLEEVYSEITGKKKKEVSGLFIWKLWDNDEKRDELLEYSISDVDSTKEIFEKIFPLFIEISRLTQVPITDVCSSTLGQLTEALLMAAAFKRGEITPPRPSEEEVTRRKTEPITGAYVKMPEPGIYEKIAVLDFRGLYPSIIVSKNLSPETYNCKCCKEANISPVGYKFCKKKQGIVPTVLNNLIRQRSEIKKRLKQEPHLLSRSQALKYLSVAFYGMLRYVRARWYSKEAAESTTAWGRKYIQDVGALAEKEGFTLLYIDTDSIFLLMDKKTEEDTVSFMKKVNEELPKSMELELEDFYSRGVFVARKIKEKGGKAERGAKKKYALINKEGKIKIRGFELVRRDWSKIARETQKKVLETILKEGDREKAMSIVKEIIENLRDGKTKMEDLVIYTQLNKSRYKIISPELAAAEKARKAGIKIPSRAIIGYVVTRNGKSISEKAQLAELVKDNDYDPDYYINNQVVPAVLKIIGELGYTEEDIKYLGKQSSLGEWV